MAPVLLHGTIRVTIGEADHLPLRGRVLLGKMKEVVGLGEVPKLCATIHLGLERVGQTRLLKHDKNPCWCETFHIYCAHMLLNVVFTVKEEDAIQESDIGMGYLPVSELLPGEKVDRWLELLDEDGKPIHKRPKIHVIVQFLDVTRGSNWDRGVKTPKFPGVPNTFFRQRKGCKVTLYQDSHVPNNFAPKVPLARGKAYKPHRAWEDVFDAINNARHLIYIAGLSIYMDTEFVRNTRRTKPGGGITLGELLKKKAAEGVRVLMLVWEGKTLVNFDEGGLIGTHDEETQRYFGSSQVYCRLCPHYPEYLDVSTVFAQHQMIVVVDSGMPNGSKDKRRIVSFVGGIDICDSRFDTQFHCLFQTANTSLHDDVHQPNLKDSSIKKRGPQEPWLDIHSQLEGPIAWDVLYSFEQRWRRQGSEFLLVNLKDLKAIIIPPSPVTFPDDRETWNVQLFKSIAGRAAFAFVKTPVDATRPGFVYEHYNIIDWNIQDAYINAIRRAKRFVYIENQYFLGSSWKCSYSDAEIADLHLIPKELSLKIVTKIEKGERFTVYIVVPIWPERIPESESVQRILNGQKMTLQMMYSHVAEALHAKGIEANPKDYLSVFCLGSHKFKKSGEYRPTEKPEPDADYIKAQEARRRMIYVHAKMIVDDEYIIFGSANIDRRLMDSVRDSAIAMGAFQPYHLRHKRPPRGQIHGFRMSLWYKYLGMLDNTFVNPEDLECVQKVNQIAQKNWDMYSSSENLEHDLPGHLLTYPINVTAKGEVVELPVLEHFPDTKAEVRSLKSDGLYIKRKGFLTFC